MQKDFYQTYFIAYDDYFGGREGKSACMRIRPSIDCDRRAVWEFFNMAARKS